MNTDRIEKSVVLKAPRQRVWEALTDAARFGVWFGASFDGPFVTGQWVAGRIEPTRMDAEVACLQEHHRGTPMAILIETMEPMTRFAFRWHPYAIEADADYAQEPTTLVAFDLEDHPDGVRLRITESGFDALPAERRAEARQANEGGWEHQSRLVAAYLEAGSPL
jgi:uncharacterized protein YndB with AHSA1/START domain